MKKIITIDTGTTNSRVTLWEGHQPLLKVFKPVGVRNTAINHGNKKQLQEALRQALNSVISQANISNHKQVQIIASGMITSNVGLIEIPHLKAPAGIDELALGMQAKNIPQVFDQPIWFIPGIRNNPKEISPKNISNIDIIRGEEVEAIGAINRLNLKGPAILILPGSHTKFIKLDNHQKIQASITSMTGELLSLLTKQSILADSVKNKFTDQIDVPALLLGQKAALDYGLGRAGFLVRLLGMFTGYTRSQKANFLLGAVLANDLKAIKNNHAFSITSSEPFIILSNKILGQALETLIEKDPTLPNPTKDYDLQNLAGIGAIEITKRRKAIENKRRKEL